MVIHKWYVGIGELINGMFPKLYSDKIQIFCIFDLWVIEFK